MEPYASALCYPRPSEAELENRLRELREHGVTAVEFAGEASVFNVPVLGKGFVGIVVTADLGGERVALKIRRVDADRAGLEHEAQMLAEANSVQVGPRLIGVSRNFLLIYPRRLMSSCILEAGYALVAGIHSTYFVRSDDDLPYMLRGAVESFHNARRIRFHEQSEIVNIFLRYKKKIII